MAVPIFGARVCWLHKINWEVHFFPASLKNFVQCYNYFSLTVWRNLFIKPPRSRILFIGKLLSGQCLPCISRCSDFLFLLVLVSNVFQRIFQLFLSCQMCLCIVSYKLTHYSLMSIGAIMVSPLFYSQYSSFVFLSFFLFSSLCPLINLTKI